MDCYNMSESSSAASYGKERKKGGAGGGRRGKAVRLSTDPQSVAARERRHRISDRFKILQSLVPGGAKMDTVSMLEEAIHYVKFLKAQIWLHQALIAGGDPSLLLSSGVAAADPHLYTAENLGGGGGVELVQSPQLLSSPAYHFSGQPGPFGGYLN
ncbi:hypothetical protein NMG60_11036006 [Bertholletia excelsa]